MIHILCERVTNLFSTYYDKQNHSNCTVLDGYFTIYNKTTENKFHRLFDYGGFLLHLTFCIQLDNLTGSCCRKEARTRLLRNV